MRTRRVFAQTVTYEKVGPKWLTESEPLTWDGWIREPAQWKGRLSRTFIICIASFSMKENSDDEKL